MSDRRVEYMPLATIEAAPRNPKKHATADIERSISRYGLAELPLIDDRTGRLVAGHGRLDDLAARKREGQDPPDGITIDPATGDWLVPVIRGWSSRSDAEAEAYLVASNRLTTLGGWDHDGLAEVLADIQAADADLLAVTGYDADDLADMLKAAEPADLDALADELGEPEESDMWPTIHVRVPPHVAAAWRSYVDTHNGREMEAFAALLDVDPESPDVPEWTP